MVNMVPHEAFACSCVEGDVVLQQSYKPDGCETRLRQLMSSSRAPSAVPSTPPSYSSGPSTPLSYSSGPSTPPNYSSGSSRNAECSNCKHLREKISVLKATMNMHMHPEQHKVNSAALLHEVLNEMKKLDLEWPPRVTLGRLLPHAKGLRFKPRRGGFPSGAKKEWGLSPKAKVRVLHTAQLDVTECMTRSSTKDLFTPFKEPERVFHSTRRLFKTTSLDYSSSSELDMFFDLKDQIEEDIIEVMGEPTIKEYMTKTREDYGS
nr:hypothetical protein [Tanacetum cinerariifolium]